VRVNSIPRMHYGARSLKRRLRLDSSAVQSRPVTAGVVMGLMVIRQSRAALSDWEKRGKERSGRTELKLIE
jgi:hypothetical protein